MNTHKISAFFRNLLTGVILCLLGSVVPVSCTDDLTPEGWGGNGTEGNIKMTVSYYPNVATDVQSRTAGDAMEKLRNLSVVIFTEDGQLYDVLGKDDLINPIGVGVEDKDTLFHNDTTTITIPEEDKNNGGSWTEGKQARATFGLKGLPFGGYKIYCVANMDITREMIAFSTDPTTRAQEEKNYETEEEKLLSIPLEWNSEHIAANDAMFGFFTISDNNNNISDAPLSRHKASTVTINKNGVQLHAWIKRAASKVTVAFDPSGLHQNVSIFIHKVTIKDIPRTCFLGKDNEPVVEDIDKRHEVLLEDGETIYYNAEGNEGNKDPKEFTSNDKEEYKEEYLKWMEENHQNWMEIDNGKSTKGSDHKATSQALFFFENMQGDYKDDQEKEKYNKEPKAGWVHEYLERPSEDQNKTPWDYDTKDKILAGTYIEVEGYYESKNDLNITSGPIKYRFMLGKNTTYNYNAQRNHHYKVTLKFKGWANQPEWHIEYVEDTPDLDAPDDFYMPYVYRERSELPIRFIGDLQTLKVEIVENDWAPYNYDDEKKTITLANPNPIASPTAKDEYGYSGRVPLAYNDDYRNHFMWNYTAWVERNGISNNSEIATIPGGKGMQYLGFLALTMPSNPPANVLDDQSYSGGKDGNKTLDGDGVLGLLSSIYYNGTAEWLPQNVLEFKTADLKESHQAGDKEDQSKTYTIYKDGEATTLMLPLFTRAKSMISAAGWSGNNPYEYHSRVAKLKITATFSVKDKEGKTVTETRERYVRVIQRPRITNPKAVWRKVGNQKGFKVTMMTRVGDALNANYKPFKSNGSWTAELEVNGGDNKDNFTLEPGPDCAYEKKENDKVNKNKLIGKTNTEIKFTIGFKGDAACGIINVKYHAEKCTHRIFVRQGDDPIQIEDGGATWLSKNLQHGGTANYESMKVGTNTEVSAKATLVDTPLSFGSYFKRGQLNEGIDESNNKEYGHLRIINPDQDEPLLLLGNKQSSKKWYQINRMLLSDSQTYPHSTTDQYVWQNVQLDGSNTIYSLPTYDDFQHLTDHSEFGFGILYGDAATETQTDFEKATGYAAMWPDGEGTSTYGMRAVVVYNKNNGNQVYFPLSASGYGRRNQCWQKNKVLAGRLLYGDVDYRLTEIVSSDNMFRPIPYNLPYNSGAIYWINKIELGNPATKRGHHEGGKYYPCAGWDMNYFNFDFGSYTAACLTRSNTSATGSALGSDALPIRLVKEHAK